MQCLLRVYYNDAVEKTGRKDSISSRGNRQSSKSIAIKFLCHNFPYRAVQSDPISSHFTRQVRDKNLAIQSIYSFKMLMTQ